MWTATRVQSLTLVDDTPSPRPEAVPARAVPSSVEAVAASAATAGGAAAAFVGAGVTGATQAGRTLAVLQLVACISGAAGEGEDHHRNVTADSDGAAAPFPQALMPWLKLGAGQTGWDRGVVVGNVATVGIVFIISLGVFTVLVRVVATLTARNPAGMAAKVGVDSDAPAAANTATVRMSRLLRFPGVAVLVPVGFAIDGFVGEAVALLRHGAEARYDATPLDAVFGGAALVTACLLWAALLYVPVVIVPRNATFVAAPGHSAPQDSHSTSSNGGLRSALYARLRALRDGAHLWTVTPSAVDANSRSGHNDDIFADISAVNPRVTSRPCCLPLPFCQQRTGDDDPQGRPPYSERCRFAARWAVLFAPLRDRALFFPALDVAASVAIAIVRGLRPRTADGCQRALIGVAAVQVALLAAVLLLRPYVAPLKTAVAATATALLALATFVGAAARLSESGDRTSYGAAAGYLAMAASLVLLANPAMAIWRVVEARVVARRRTALHDASAPLLSDEERSSTPDNGSSLSFEMDGGSGRGPGTGNAAGWVWGGDHGEVCEAMADIVAAEVEAPVDVFPDPFDTIGPAMTPSPPPPPRVRDDENELPVVPVRKVVAGPLAGGSDLSDFSDFDFADAGPPRDAAVGEGPPSARPSPTGHGVHRRVYRDGDVVVAKGGEGAVIAAELEAMFSGFL